MLIIWLALGSQALTRVEVEGDFFLLILKSYTRVNVVVTSRHSCYLLSLGIIELELLIKYKQLVMALMGEHCLAFG